MFDSGKAAQAAKIFPFYVQIMFLQNSGDHYCSRLTLSHLEYQEHIHKESAAHTLSEFIKICWGLKLQRLCLKNHFSALLVIVQYGRSPRFIVPLWSWWFILKSWEQSLQIIEKFLEI